SSLAAEIDMVTGVNRRSREFSVQALLPYQLAGRRFQARCDAPFVHQVQQVIDEERGAARGYASTVSPIDVRGGDVATAIGAHGQQAEAVVAGAQEELALSKLRWRRHIHAAVPHAPEFLSRLRIVGKGRH